MSLYTAYYGDENASAIVFLHGGGISGWMWNKQVSAFADYHCIVPDLPEHGHSIFEQPMTISDSADQIAQLIRIHAKGGKAHVVGHSIGAKIIVELLSRHPDVIDHAVIVSALFVPIPMLKYFCNRFIYKLTVMMLKNRWILAYQVRQFGFAKGDEQHLADDFRLLTVDHLDHVYGELYKHLKLPDHLQSAKSPSLILAGEKEPLAMRKSVGLIASALPNAKGMLIRGCKHDIPWKASDAFNQIVRSWLQGQAISSDDIMPMR